MIAAEPAHIPAPPGDFIKRFPDDQGREIFTISHTGFNFSKTEAIFYFDRHGGGGGGGGYILARKGDGVWRVVDDHATWMF